ncbi:MAG: lysoplasmalogenase [Chloroflexota bacterium]
MFGNLDSSFERWWMVGLLAAWAALLFGGFLFGSSPAENQPRMPLWTRIGSSIVLVIAAWSLVGFGRQETRFLAKTEFLVAVGMSLGLLGDLFMAELLRLGNRVMSGIGAFGLGHVVYIVAFLGLAGAEAPTTNVGSRWLAWAAWLLFGVVGWYFVVFRGQPATTLHYAALPYALLLASTAGVATGLALLQPAYIPLAVGAALFLTSDLILAAQLFNGLRFPFIGDVIWLTYGPAQMLIVYSAGRVW